MFCFQSAARCAVRVRLRCVIRKRCLIMKRLHKKAGPSIRPQAFQFNLFTVPGGRLRVKRVKRTKRSIKGLQYRLKIRLRETPRKIAYRLHAGKDQGTNAYEWNTDGIVRLHTVLLRESLASLRSMCEKQSARAAEIMAWIMRDAPDEPFSFIQCCEKFHLEDEGEVVGAQDPEVLRTMTCSWIRKTWDTDLPHAAVLRQGILDAEGGDDDAFEWVMSDAKAPLSFHSCCDALGFDPEAARKEIHCPTRVPSADEELSQYLDKLFARVFGPNQQTALAA